MGKITGESEEEEEQIENWEPTGEVAVDMMNEDAEEEDEVMDVEEVVDGEDYGGLAYGEDGDDREREDSDEDEPEQELNLEVGEDGEDAAEWPGDMLEYERERSMVSVNEDEVEVHPIIPGPPSILDQPFMTAGFHLLSDMMQAGRTEAYELLGHGELDVDRWELVMSPKLYLERFKDTLTTVQLVNRAPKRPLATTYHRGPGFNRWLLLAQANYQLWVDTKYKKDFFRHLTQYQTAQPGRFLLQASSGKALIPTSIFIHCLTQAECDTMKIKAFGQKMPITCQFLHSKPAETNHRWAVHNEWDIGKNFNSPYIWLFDSAAGRRHGIERFPMLVPGSRDYGTVNVKLTHLGNHCSVKIYPRMVHVIKSFNSGLQSSIPRTLRGVNTQVQAAVAMIHNLTGKDPNELGGFRIEVTVRAANLEEQPVRSMELPS